MFNRGNRKYYNIGRKRKRDNPEGRLQREIIFYLRTLGIPVGKTKTMGVKRGNVWCYDPFTFRGKCDLECFYNGIMYAIEVKSPTGKMSLEQEEYRQLFHKPPDRIYLLAKKIEDVTEVIG